VAPPSRDPPPWRRRPLLTPCPTGHLHHHHRPLRVAAAKASSPPAR
jgi:hypothetical protein